jgi:hypothetical protein
MRLTRCADALPIPGGIQFRALRVMALAAAGYAVYGISPLQNRQAPASERTRGVRADRLAGGVTREWTPPTPAWFIHIAMVAGRQRPAPVRPRCLPRRSRWRRGG